MSESSEKRLLLALSAPPFWHCGRTVRKNSLHALLALTPAVAFGLWHWGLPAARVMTLAMLVAMLTEMGCLKIMGREVTLEDGAAAISGLLLAFLLPASAPWWLVALGAGLAISLGKMAFGGLGANPVCATLVGWALMLVSFPQVMDPNSMLLNTDFVDPLLRLKYFGAEAVEGFSYLDLALGRQIGALGAAQSGALLLGGLYLAARGVIRWEIAVFFLLGVLLTAGVFNIMDPTRYAHPFFHVLTGSTVLAAFFLATEASCSPDRPIPMMLYGLTGGVLAILIRLFGVYTDGAPFAVMLINLLAPHFDLIRPRPFGLRAKGGKSA